MEQTFQNAMKPAEKLIFWYASLKAFISHMVRDVRGRPPGPLKAGRPDSMPEAVAGQCSKMRESEAANGKYEGDRPYSRSFAGHCLSCPERHGESAGTIAQAGSRCGPKNRVPAQPT